MPETLSYLITGTVFGLTAGISPGPLLTLVISQTIKHNRAEGIKTAMAPLLTDLPIILFTLLALSRLSNSDPILGSISIAGSLFIVYLGLESIRTKGIEIKVQSIKPRSIRKSIIVNATSPHPYLFWLTVGAPIIFKAYHINPGTAAVFIIAFYVLLVGSKVGVAVLVDRSRGFLKNRAYIWAMRVLGIILLVFAAIYIRDGLQFFGIL